MGVDAAAYSDRPKLYGITAHVTRTVQYNWGSDYANSNTLSAHT